MSTDSATLLDALVVEHVSKTYGSRAKAPRALDDVSFSVKQGEIFGLLGPNGAGKSTLIGVLAGTVVLNSGSVSLLGHSLADNMRYCKMAVGIVPQEISFDPFFTVWETLRLQSGFYGLRNNDAWLDELLEELGLMEKKHASVSRLSGGMKRRVLIAQALVHRPPVIVLDEPTAGVDVELRQRLWRFICKLNSQGHTIILTTHYLEEAQQLCTRLAMLNHGKIIALDDTAHLLKSFSARCMKFNLVDGPLPKSTERHTFERAENGLWAVNYETAADLKNILQMLEDAGSQIDGIETGETKLEDVFIKMVTDHAGQSSERGEAV